ncbi:MAG: WbqC family protein [Chitinophagales bacterium]|nr:WbqC family protein [Chitinophagales bacterium]
MQQIVTSLIPFPNIRWWSVVADHTHVIFDHAEHFAKMTYRNRYYITGANGLIQLTVPLAHGRNQRTAMQDVLIDNKERWQVQHWRTLFSVYGRTPYFEHYAPSLEQLFLQKFDKLVAFNEASVHWLKKELRIGFDEESAPAYKKYELPVHDMRNACKPGMEKKAMPESEGLYYQVFSERNGFYPNLSMLDLLFAEGPAAMSIINRNKEIINRWV